MWRPAIALSFAPALSPALSPAIVPVFVTAVLLLLPSLGVAQSADAKHSKPHGADHHSEQTTHPEGPQMDSASPYAGFEQRDIKSLSEQDLIDLRKGSGWGLALAAELNGVPGPAHLLELREQIGLTPEQVTAIEVIYADMQTEAQAAGKRLIEAEGAIEAGFRDGDMSPQALRELIEISASARAELRYVHLSRHLETPPLLSPVQIERYNTLRGYGGDSSQDPCTAVPEGHDPEMWRRHNQCDD